MLHLDGDWVEDIKVRRRLIENAPRLMLVTLELAILKWNIENLNIMSMRKKFENSKKVLKVENFCQMCPFFQTVPSLSQKMVL